MTRIFVILFFLCCYASAYTVVSGGVRSGSITQEIAPSVARNPYWYDVDLDDISGSPTNYSLVYSTNQDVQIIGHRTAPSFKRFVPIINRGRLSSISVSLNTNAASHIVSDVLVDGGVSEAVTATFVSRGIELQKEFDLTGSQSNEYHFVSGSLGEHAVDEISSLTNQYGYTVDSRSVFIDSQTGWTAAWTSPHADWKTIHPEFTNIFTVSSRTVERNMNCFLAGIDTSCVSVWNSYDKNHRAGTLVTPRHFINAHHYTIPNGSSVVFIDMQGNSFTGTVSQSAFIETEYFGDDIQLCRLENEMPSNIVPCAVLSSNWFNYFGTEAYVGYTNLIRRSFASECDYPILYIDQMRVLNLATMGLVPSSITGTDAVDWDSGCPVFSIINNAVVLLFCFQTSNSGPGIDYSIDEINTQIAAWGDTQTVHEVSLGSFNTYMEE